MSSFNCSMFPVKKLWKICFYGVTVICLLSIYFYISQFTKYNSIRKPTDLQLLENINKFQETAEATQVKSLGDKTRYLKRKQTEIMLIKQNDSHPHNNSITSAMTVLTWTKQLVALADWKPFRFYIYDLPQKFNDDLIKCLADSPHYQGCFDLTNNGMGKLLTAKNGFLVTNSNQFSLEVIIHQQLLHHPYRTMNVSSADAYYVPAYMGLACFCFDSPGYRIEELYKYLNNEFPFQQSKPHFSTLAKIEREQASKNCPLLVYQESRKLTFIGIERETNTKARFRLTLNNQQTIVAPYPSYIHYKNTSHMETPGIQDRNVFILLAASVRRTNYFRAILIDQFENKTHDSYEDFYNVAKNKAIKQVMLITPECRGNHKFTTIPWMMHSVFCLQPPGDSPTRKSFYDAILSGCIPVLFHYASGYRVRYPFDWHFNYTDFTVILPAINGIATYPDIYETLSQIPNKVIERLHKNLDNVAKYFQYSVISEQGRGAKEDAMTLLLEELRHLYKLNE